MSATIQFPQNRVILTYFNAMRLEQKTAKNIVNFQFAVTMRTSIQVESQLVSPPCHNIPCIKLLKFGDILTICAHFCEVCTSYNQVGLNEEDFVDMKDQRPRVNKQLKKRANW